MAEPCGCLPGETDGLYQYTFRLEEENDRLRRRVSALLNLLVLGSIDQPELVEAGRVVI